MPSLVTGFPGFIGRRLVAHLLEAGPDVAVTCLVEPRMAAPARAAAAEIDAARIQVVEGDVAQRRLGLDTATYERLAAEVDRVYHLAAIYDLAVPIKVAQSVNVAGTGHVLEFCLDAPGLKRLTYVSTAYVAGRRHGVVYEHELVMGQDFKNHYESTKFQAEVWVRQLMDRIPTTVLRPAIVVGDARTGETAKFDGPYYLLRAVAQADGWGRPVMQFGRAQAPFNVVPVDYVVRAMATAAADPAAAGETLHLVDPEPLSAAELLAALSQEYAGRGPKGKLPAGVVAGSLRIPPVRRFFNNTPRESIAYLNHPVTFDARRAVDLLAPHDLRPPHFTEYVGAMVRFFKAHEHDPALAPKAAL
jgi:thioester reductase-like protein